MNKWHLVQQQTRAIGLGWKRNRNGYLLRGQFIFNNILNKNRVDLFPFFFLLRGIDPAAEDNDALRWAAGEGHLTVVQYLVSLVPQFPRIDPAAGDNLALRWAAENGHLTVVKVRLCLPSDR